MDQRFLPAYLGSSISEGVGNAEWLSNVGSRAEGAWCSTQRLSAGAVCGSQNHKAVAS